jgi:acetyltransferase-like isoleucine patch superfamily enzyme
MIKRIQSLCRIFTTSGTKILFQYIFYRIRNELCRIDLILKGVKVGRDNFYYGRVEAIFHGGGKIKIGDRNNFSRYVLLKAGQKGEIIIGNDCTISRFCMIQASSRIVLEDGVQVAPFVHMVDGKHYFADEKTDLSLRQLDLIKGIMSSPIVIHKNAWICSGAIILEGVTIGEGAVVGAGSVVTRDIPADTVAAGVPCRVIRFKKEKQIDAK